MYIKILGLYAFFVTCVYLGDIAKMIKKKKCTSVWVVWAFGLLVFYRSVKSRSFSLRSISRNTAEVRMKSFPLIWNACMLYAEHLFWTRLWGFKGHSQLCFKLCIQINSLESWRGVGSGRDSKLPPVGTLKKKKKIIALPNMSYKECLIFLCSLFIFYTLSLQSIHMLTQNSNFCICIHFSCMVRFLCSWV